MNRLLISCLALICAAGMHAQKVNDYFKLSPSALFHPIDSLARIQMCEMNASVSNKGVTTMFGDSITVNEMNDSYLKFTYSNTVVQIKLVDDVIIVSQTYGSEVKNSEVSFYDTEWNHKSSWIYGARHSKMMPSDKKLFESLVVKPDTMVTDEFERLKLYLDPMLVVAELSANDDNITLYAECPLLSEDEKKELKTILKQKTFKWTNGRFK